MYDLKINEVEVARYLGMKESQIDEETSAEIKRITEQLIVYVKDRAEYRVFDIQKENNSIIVKGTNLKLKGKSIQKLLADCEQCILLAVTLGQRVDAQLRTLQVTSLNQAVIMDFCASSMVEELCNQLEEELKAVWLNRGLYLTDRFSPGYGDMSLEVQAVLCEVLETSKKIGLHVTSSGIMIPKKSITAIIGIANKKQKMKIKGCKYCDFYKNCEYRKGGRVCD
ncbi:MAG: vitamin B12 dependent-methionine synthase activation domain-containing protein [Eubacteriales bacterium]